MISGLRCPMCGENTVECERKSVFMGFAVYDSFIHVCKNPGCRHIVESNCHYGGLLGHAFCPMCRQTHVIGRE